MNRVTLLVIISLAPAIGAGGSLDLPFGSRGVYSPYDGAQDGASELADGYRGYRYGEAARGVPESRDQGRSEGRLWVPAPEPSLGQERLNAYQTGSPPAYEPRRRAQGLYEQFRPDPGVEDSPWWGRNDAGMPDSGAVLQDDVGRYRFRGDEHVGADPRYGGYRFRPLTEQERARMDEQPGWRPTGRAYAPPSSPYSRPSIPEREAYGYEPDGWFGRYFGEGRR